MCLHGPMAGSSSCGHRMRGRDGEIVAFHWASSSTDGEDEHGCVSGAVDPVAVTVQVAFADGQHLDVQEMDHVEPPPAGLTQ